MDRDGAATFPSLDKEGKPRPGATAGVVRTIVESQISGGIDYNQALGPGYTGLLDVRDLLQPKHQAQSLVHCLLIPESLAHIWR